MDIELPSDDGSSNDDSVFDGRIDRYEAYWLYVDGMRFTSTALGRSAATEDDDHSPLARHYNHFYEKKEKYKRRCSELPGNLPKYKDHFQEPRGDARQVSKDELDDLGISIEEGDDPIWLPSEYELPPVWEDDLENMDTAEMRELIKKLRKENGQLRNDRDTLRDQLETVSQSLSNYLDKGKSDENSQNNRATETSPSSASPICEKCGKRFNSKSAMHGHKPHCNETASQDSRNGKDSGYTSEPVELEQLAEELPEVSEQQSTTSHEALSAEEELENLNHLLNSGL